MTKRRKKRKTRKKLKRKKTKIFKTVKAIKTESEKELIIKITKAWSKKAYVNKG